MSKSGLTNLFKKFLEDDLSEAEVHELFEKINQGYKADELDPFLKDAFRSAEQTGAGEEYQKDAFGVMLSRIHENRGETLYPGVRRAGRGAIFLKTRYRVAAAVIALVFLGGGYLYFYKQPVNHSVSIRPIASAEISPGTTGAILTLADGRKVVLDSASDGTLVQQGNSTVIKKTGQLSYHASAGSGYADSEPAASKSTRSANLPVSPIRDANSEALLLNTMTTARGKQYQLVLADGTTVWLNAASSIRFPTGFTGPKRVVQVSGEAYFEVAPDKSKPFVVQAGASEVTVLGTHFNIMDYSDEGTLNTTLLEGAVRVRSGGQVLTMKPGDQVRLEKSTGQLSTGKVDAGQVAAWTRGRLYLGNSNFDMFMRAISRWYDVDVVYQGKIPNLHIRGFIHSDISLSNVMSFLGENGIHYNIRGKTIFIMPN